MKKLFGALVPLVLAIALVAPAAHAATIDTPIGFPLLDAPGWWRLLSNGADAGVRGTTAPAGFGTKSLLLKAGPNSTPGTGGQAVVSTYLIVLPELTKITDFQTLSYYTYAFPESPGSVATLQMSVDIDGDLQWDTNLVYVPSSNGTVVAGFWQYWQTLGGKWYSTQDIGIAGQGNPATLAEIQAAHPDAAVALIPSDPGGPMRVQFGSSGGDEANARTLVDGVVIKTTLLPRFRTDFEGLGLPV